MTTFDFLNCSNPPCISCGVHWMYLLDLFIGTKKNQKLWPFCCNIWVTLRYEPYLSHHRDQASVVAKVDPNRRHNTLFRRSNYQKIWKWCCEWTKNEQSSTRSRVFCSEKSVLFVFLISKLWSQGLIIFFSNPVSHLPLIICYCLWMIFTTRTDSELHCTVFWGSATKLSSSQ